MLDMSFTRGFFSELAHSQDICHYCEKAIREERNKGNLNFDEFTKAIKKLTGSLNGKRVAKLRYVGHEFCICETCLESIASEVIVSEKNDAAINEIKEVITKIANPIIEEAIKSKAKTKAKGK